MADPSRTASVGDGLDGLKRVGLPASAHQRPGMASKLVAETYAVSRAWVDRLKQRRRETGEIAPRRQTRWRTPRLPAQLPRLAILIREQPDRTLVELPQALPTSASLLTIWRAVTKLGFRLKKNGARGSAGCKDVKICSRWSLPSGQATRG